MPAASASAEPRLAAVILAAGGSTRLGQPKQLVKYRGKALILRTVHLARLSVGGPVIVVLGDQQQRMRSLLRRHDRRLTIVNNADWQQGLATSLQAGLKRVPRTTNAALILLVDQAKLGASDISRLISGWCKRPGKPAAAAYLGTAGAPAVIPRSRFGEVFLLDGDAGARSLLHRLSEVSLVDMPAAGFDVDTPADAAALTA